MAAFLREFAFILIDAIIKTTVLLALVLLIAFLSRRASASLRHLIWALGLGAALFMPVLSSHLPHWRIPITTTVTHTQPSVGEAPLPSETPQATPKAAPSTVSAPVASAPSATSSHSSSALSKPVTKIPVAASGLAAPHTHTLTPGHLWTVGLLLVWACGMALVLAHLANSLTAVRRIGRASVPIAIGPAASAVILAAEAMQVRRPITLRQASSPGQVAVPLIYGERRPVIILPADAQDWPKDRLRAALLHEMAHVRRHDWRLQIVAHVVLALYWFHPLVWIAVRRMRAESEAACDDLVLGAGMPAKDYARHLLDVALCARQARTVSCGAVAMAQTPRVEGRLRAVLAQGLSRRPVTRRTAAGVFVTSLLLILPVAAFRLIAQGQPVPDADRLQLQGDFTLRYAVTITDSQTTQVQFREYQQIRADYQRALGKDPYVQPIAPEFYAPFSYYQSRRPKARHIIITVSSQEGKLLWRSEEDGHTQARLYNGRNGTQLFSDGHAGRIESGLQFADMSNCPLPAVGLPYVPLIKKAVLRNSWQDRQTWEGVSPIEDAEQQQGQALYFPAVVHTVREGGAWKVLDVDTSDQQFQFLQHQRFQGFWIASHMILTKYTEDTPPALPPSISSLEDFMTYMDAHRRPTSVCEYRLLSASATPLDLSAVGMRTVSAIPHSNPAASAPPWDRDDFYTQEALHLRYHLQDWAIANKALLQNMAQGQPSNVVAASRVAKTLQVLPIPLWQDDPRPGRGWDDDPRISYEGHKPVFVSEYPSQQSLSARDFPFARSRNPGPFQVVLWASGRITVEATRVGSAIPESKEIVPAFFENDGTSNMAGDAPKAAADTPVLPAPERATLQQDYMDSRHVAAL